MASAPSQPVQPDPTATASAQGEANANTAVAQTLLNNANQVTPYGTSTTAATGSYSYTQPDGTVTNIPTFTTTQQLSADQQKLYNEQVSLSNQYNNGASLALHSINQDLAHPVTNDSLQPLVNSLNVPTLASSYDSGGQVQTGYDQGGALQNTYASGGAIQSSVPYALEGTNAPSTFGQTSSAIQNDVNLNANAPTTFGQTQNGVQYFNGGDFSAERDAATNAALQRLAPSMAAQQESMNAGLASQGLTQGSAAWNAAQLSQSQANNDLRLGAVATGDQEQQALFGEQATGNQLYNSAQQQDYSQQQGRGQFAQAGIAQNNAATLAAGQFHNSAQQQDYSQLADRAAYAQSAYGIDNAAIGANNTAALNAGNFANSAQLQSEQENAARSAFSNATQAQQTQENASAAAFSNTAQAQQNAQNQQAAAFSNNAAQGLFGMNQAAATFANQSREQDLTDQETINNNVVNQASALTHGGQVTTGQYAGYSPGQVGQTPVSTDTYSSANLSEQAYQAQLQADAASNSSMFSTFGGLFGMGGNYLAGRTITPTGSDRRIKRDVTALGPASNGLPLYSFRYVWDEDEAPLRHGHMAQEVMRVRPDAVYRMPAGYLAVDYGAL